MMFDQDGRPLGYPRCGAHRCSFCGPYEAGLLCDAIAEEGRPRWFVTLDDLGNDWPTIHRRMNKLAESLSESVRFSWLWVVHQNIDRDDPGAHVHALAKGEPGSREVLWIVGARHVTYAQPAYNVPGAAAYMLQRALNGGSQLEQLLDWNGGRQFAHWSLDFFPGGKVEAVDRVRKRRRRLD